MVALLLTLVAAFTGGLFLWTLLEYIIHGVLSHMLKTFVSQIHWTHHRDPRLVFTGPIWIAVALPIGALLLWGFGALAGGGLTAGMVAGFFLYEWVHWRIHYRLPANALERRLRAHHLAHHHRTPKLRHGVTTTFWDRVFRTLPPEPLDLSLADRPPLKADHGFLEGLLGVHGIRL
jgi:sterol desaturase/sphingolipid hydroxylase (fatty acid hydroxylase superfamily)